MLLLVIYLSFHCSTYRYRAGQEIGTIAGIAADFGQYFTKKDVEW
jgi:hypothetical protein